MGISPQSSVLSALSLLKQSTPHSVIYEDNNLLAMVLEVRSSAINMLAGHTPSEGSREESVLCFSYGFGGCQKSLAFPGL